MCGATAESMRGWENIPGIILKAASKECAVASMVLFLLPSAPADMVLHSSERTRRPFRNK